jgi:hypothetical protein
MTIEREEAQKHNRYHHTDLRPLVTTHASKGRYMSSSPANEYGASATPASLSSAIRLASLSLAAVRKYYQDHVRRTVLQTELSLTEHRFYFLEIMLRRHSILSLSSLATRMERIAVSSALNDSGGEQMRERRSVAEVPREMLLYGVNRSELAKLGSFVSRRPLMPHPSILLTISARISADPTLDRMLA